MTPVTAVALGVLTVTSYMSVPSQTDSTPHRTAINHRTHPLGVAVSRDLLQSGEACYGDVLYVEGFGLRVVNDTMNIRHERSLDLFVETKAEEGYVGTQRLRVWVMQSPVRACTRKEAMTMAMVNAKKLRKTMDAFKKQHGREATFDELKAIMRGNTSRTPNDKQGPAAAGDNHKGRTDH